jgi:hypothetical protein
VLPPPSFVVLAEDLRKIFGKHEVPEGFSLTALDGDLLPGCGARVRRVDAGDESV